MPTTPDPDERDSDRAQEEPVTSTTQTRPPVQDGVPTALESDRPSSHREPVIPESRMPKALDLGAVASQLRADGHLAAAMRRAAADPAAADALIEDAQRAAAQESRARQREARYARYAEHRPGDFADSSYARLLPQQNPEGRVTGWVESGARTLLLAGPPARGKTDAAYAVCNEVAAADRDGAHPARTVRAHSFPDLRALLQPVGAHAARDEVVAAERARILDEVMSCDLLLLDDVTATDHTDATRNLLYRILDARTNNPKARTIITANAAAKDKLADALEPLGAHVVSRLRKDCVAAWIAGENMRTYRRWDPFAT